MELRDPKLLRSQCYVNGQWLDAADGRSTPVHNPATGVTLGTVPQLDGAATRARSTRPPPRFRAGPRKPPNSVR